MRCTELSSRYADHLISFYGMSCSWDVDFLPTRLHSISHAIQERMNGMVMVVVMDMMTKYSILHTDSPTPYSIVQYTYSTVQYNIYYIYSIILLPGPELGTPPGSTRAYHIYDSITESPDLCFTTITRVCTVLYSMDTVYQ